MEELVRYYLLACKKGITKELMTVAWHPTRWWDWCIPEDDKKEIKPIFDWWKLMQNRLPVIKIDGDWDKVMGNSKKLAKAGGKW